MTERKFGFQVVAPTDARSRYSDQEYWQVRLPHSCDHWVIGYSKDQGKVVADLQRFIREAQDALGELRKQIRETQAPGIKS